MDISHPFGHSDCCRYLGKVEGTGGDVLLYKCANYPGDVLWTTVEYVAKYPPVNVSLETLSHRSKDAWEQKIRPFFGVEVKPANNTIYHANEIDVEAFRKNTYKRKIKCP